MYIHQHITFFRFGLLYIFLPIFALQHANYNFSLHTYLFFPGCYSWNYELGEGSMLRRKKNTQKIFFLSLKSLVKYSIHKVIGHHDRLGNHLGQKQYAANKKCLPQTYNSNLFSNPTLQCVQCFSNANFGALITVHIST